MEKKVVIAFVHTKYILQIVEEELKTIAKEYLVSNYGVESFIRDENKSTNTLDIIDRFVNGLTDMNHLCNNDPFIYNYMEYVEETIERELNGGSFCPRILIFSYNEKSIPSLKDLMTKMTATNGIDFKKSAVVITPSDIPLISLLFNTVDKIYNIDFGPKLHNFNIPYHLPRTMRTTYITKIIMNYIYGKIQIPDDTITPTLSENIEKLEKLILENKEVLSMDDMLSFTKVLNDFKRLNKTE